MEILLIAAIAGIAWAVWSKARDLQRAHDEIEYLQGVVRGQAAALKLKREQDRLKDEHDAQKDHETVEKIRAAGDKSAAIGFLRDSFRPSGSGPGPDVPRPVGETEPADDD